MSSIPAALGIDAGSATLKTVAVDNTGKMIAALIEPTKPRIAEQAEQQIQAILQQLGTNTDTQPPIVATGYGRKLVARATEHVTEITCHAKGVFHYFNHGGTLVDIGGQDSKVIVIGDNGHVVDFAMNDKCAAGTGRFLEHTAGRLDIDLEKMGELALKNEHPAHITSTCTVFAESEIISLLAEGTRTEDILSGLHAALVARLMGLVKSVGYHPPLMMSGGVANNKAIQVYLSRVLGGTALVPEQPQLMGAYGAALVAMELPS
ncbi:MAG TPA: acyl-CoA dehydratase activase [Pseudomonadales bacterium]|nr:acyl-CoA dehydratase activase [Pseudomonadales bacterium]